MKKTKLIITLIFTMLFFLTTGSVYAIDSLQGRGSVGASITLQKTEISYEGDSVSSDQRIIQGSIGRFLTDNVEVNFAPMIISIDADGEEMSVYSYFGNVKFNFITEGQTAVPYAGLQAGISGVAYGDEDDSSLGYGFMGGIKMFLNEDLSLDIELNYLMAELEVGDVTADVATTSVFVGFKYYFGGY